MTDHKLTLALVDAMKSRGVRSFAVGDVRVEFGPVEMTLAPASAAVDSERCPCGCLVTDHSTAGLCMAKGCAPERCVEKKT